MIKTVSVNLKTWYFHHMANYHLRKANKVTEGTDVYYSNQRYWYYFNKSIKVNG